MHTKLRWSIGILLVVVAVGATSLVLLPVQAQTSTSGVGGTIFFGNPSVSGGDLRVPVYTSRATDFFIGADVSVNFDTSLISLTNADTTGSILPQPIVCFTSPNPPQGAVAGCASLTAFGTQQDGLLLTLVFTGQAGCTNMHIVTLNAPDDGGVDFGSYTLNASDAVPQSNAYGPDITVDTQTGATGCSVSTPTPTATSTPTATATPSPTATATPPWFHCLTPEPARAHCGPKK